MRESQTIASLNLRYLGLYPSLHQKKKFEVLTYNFTAYLIEIIRTLPRLKNMSQNLKFDKKNININVEVKKMLTW